MTLNILVAMEESGRTTTQLRNMGHNAFSCDILDCSYPQHEWHIKGDVTPLLNGHCSFTTMDGTLHTIDGKWDLIIAHPPCTYFSTAGAVRLFPNKTLDPIRYQKGLIMRDLFMSVYNADCDFIAIENPTPMKIWKLPSYQQAIQPWMFDEDGTGHGTQCKY